MDIVVVFERNIDFMSMTDVSTLSGPGGATFRVLDVHSGDLLVEHQLHHPESGRLHEPASLGVAVAFESTSTDSDVFVLTNGHTVRRVSSTTGEVRWGWSSPDQT